MKYFACVSFGFIFATLWFTYAGSIGLRPPGTKTFVLKYPDKVAEFVYQHIADTAKVDMGVSCVLEKK